jgi:hypothetical protein
MLINDASITGSLIVNASASFQNISVGGNIIPDETNIRNLGSTDKYFKEIYVSTGSINFVDGGSVVAVLSAGTITAIQSNTSSANSRLNAIESVSASLQSFTASISTTNTFTSSATARLNALETTSASIDTLNSTQNNRLGSLETISASNISRISALETTSASVDTLNTTQNSRLNALETTSASVDTLNTTQNSRLTSLEIKTGSLATTGSNTFIGTQTITGSLYISSDLVVQGSSSLQNITASAVSIGTNIINLNTANPAIRYAGLSIGDSGSIGSSGSFLYDSVQDEMIFIHRGANTTVTSSVVLMGPQTFDNIGSETYPTLNIVQKGTGNEHLVDSCIFDNGTTVCVNATLKASGQVCGVMGTFNCIGIGTTTPNKPLDIRGSDIYETSQLALSSVQGTNRLYLGTNNGAYISLGGTYTCAGLVTDGNNAMAQISMQAFDGGSYMNFATTTCNNVEPSTRMFISAVGNVSIGTALPPYAKLVVYKGVECGCIGKVLDTTIQLDGENYGACNWPAQIGFGYPSYGFTYNPVAIAYIPQTGVGSGNADLAFYTRTATTDTAPSQRMRISSTGVTSFACQICVAGTTLPNDLFALNFLTMGG